MPVNHIVSSPDPLVNLPDEVWRDIPGYEGKYQVSNMGRVKSLQRHNAKERILKLSIHNSYYCAQLFVEGQWKRPRVHCLVMLAFVGQRPDGYHVDHINFNRLDNRLINLRYIPAAQNIGEATARRNRICCGEKHPFSKLTDRQRCEIRQLHAQGVLTNQIAKQYGISKRLVRDLVAGTRGAHIDCAGRAALDGGK